VLPNQRPILPPPDGSVKLPFTIICVMLSTPTCVLSISGDRAIAVTLSLDARRALELSQSRAGGFARELRSPICIPTGRRKRERERENIYAYIYIGVRLCLAASPCESRFHRRHEGGLGREKGKEVEKKERKKKEKQRLASRHDQFPYYR